MRFMLIVRASKAFEAWGIPSREHINAMMNYNEKLVKAGVLVAAEGLHPSSNGFRITYPIPGAKPEVVEGPFADEIAGFTLIEVNSREEALEWALHMPDPHGFGGREIELRQVKETPE